MVKHCSYLVIIFTIFIIILPLDLGQGWSVLQLFSQIIQQRGDRVDGQNVHGVHDEVVSEADETAFKR